MLSAANLPPFEIGEDTDAVDENLRLKYRFLDLRREKMQNNLRVRLSDGSSVLIPYVPQFIAAVDTENGTLTVQNTEGLL